MKTSLPLPADLASRPVHDDGDGTTVVPLRATGPAGPSRYCYAMTEDGGRCSDLIIRIPASTLLDSAETGEAIGMLDRTPTDDEWSALLRVAARAMAAAEVSILGAVAAGLRSRLGDPTATPASSGLAGLLRSAREETEESMTRDLRPEEARRLAEAVRAAFEQELGGDIDADDIDGRTVAMAVATVGDRLAEIAADAVADGLQQSDLLTDSSRVLLRSVAEAVSARGYSHATARAVARDLRREVVASLQAAEAEGGDGPDMDTLWSTVVDIASRHGVTLAPDGGPGPA